MELNLSGISNFTRILSTKSGNEDISSEIKRMHGLIKRFIQVYVDLYFLKWILTALFGYLTHLILQALLILYQLSTTKLLAPI